jgi:hypothetical protein
MNSVDLLVISPGGRKKVYAPPHLLHYEDFQNQARLHDPELDRFRLPACELYNGPHHRLVMEGVQALRSVGVRVDLRLLSPAWGLLRETEPILPYDLPLDQLNRAEAEAWLERLGLGRAIQEAVAGAGLAILLLPAKYLRPLRAAGHQLRPPQGGRLLAFVAPGDSGWTGEGVVKVSVDPALTKSFGAPNTALKGALFRALARGIAASPAERLGWLRADRSAETVWRLIAEGRPGR